MEEIKVIDLAIPSLGEAESTEIIEINISAGQVIAKNDPLLVLESEKAAMEIPSDCSGKVLEVLLKEGDQVSEGEIYARIEVEEGVILEKKHEQKEESKKNLTAPQQPKIKKQNIDFSGVNAGPAVRKYARELEIDISKISGTGRNNQITKEDLKKFIHQNNASSFEFSRSFEENFDSFQNYEINELSKIQKIGAENLHQSWLTIPHVTHYEEVNMENINKISKSKMLTPLSIISESFIKAVSEFPIFNSSLINDGKLLIKKEINLGIAVNTLEGLVVPVIANANTLGAKEIMIKISELADKAKNKKLMQADIKDSTVTISSLGKIGGTGFTPIINPPEVCILGISRTKKELALDEKGSLKENIILPISLSYDHRVINGADAGKFMSRLREILETVK